ncbi:hypothetical protein APHAL10511_002106 [Amanita phalloides]|nr:hypothetical protein APHAL10511_002106 [Amanita phalloides]
MLHRTFAIYSNSKQIKALLIGGYVLGLSATLVILVILTTTFNAQKSILYLRPVECYLLHVPSFAAIFWIPALIYKLVFIAVAMRVSIRHTRLVNSLGRNHIVTWAVFVKDSIFYFFLTSSLLAINAVVWLTLSPQWFRIFEGFSIAAICAAGNRLVFKLVELYYDPHEDNNDEDGDVALQNITSTTAVGIYEQVVHEL